MLLTINDFKVTKNDFDIEGLAISFYQISNYQELLDKVGFKVSEQKPEKLKAAPHWAKLWNSSTGLGKYLVKNNIIKPGMKVIELGCGLGFSGVVAAKLGADVIFTDYDPAALDFAEKNCVLNGIENAQFEIMDWNEPNPAFEADLVIGADIAYGPNYQELLLKTFKTVCKPGGKILLSCPNRGFSWPFYETLEKSEYKMSFIRQIEVLNDFSTSLKITTLIKPN